MALCGTGLQCRGHIDVEQARKSESGHGRIMVVEGRPVTAYARRVERPESFGQESPASEIEPGRSWLEVLEKVQARVRGLDAERAWVSVDKASATAKAPNEGDRIRVGEHEEKYAHCVQSGLPYPITVDVAELERVLVSCSWGTTSAEAGWEALEGAGVAPRTSPLGTKTAFQQMDNAPSDEAVLGVTLREEKVVEFPRLPLEVSQAGSTIPRSGGDLRSAEPCRLDGLWQDHGTPEGPFFTMPPMVTADKLWQEHGIPGELSTSFDDRRLPNRDGSRLALDVGESPEGAPHGTATEEHFWASPTRGSAPAVERGALLTGESPSLTALHTPLKAEDDTSSRDGHGVNGSTTKTRPVPWENHPGPYTEEKPLAVSAFRNDVLSDVDAASAMDRVARAIRRAYDRGVDRIAVEVRTADSPKVTVEVFAHGQEVTAKFLSPDERLLLLLETNVNLLKESLAGQGLIFAGAHFSLHKDQDKGASGGHERDGAGDEGGTVRPGRRAGLPMSGKGKGSTPLVETLDDGFEFLGRIVGPEDACRRIVDCLC